MALFDGSVEPTQGEKQRMENADGLRKNVKSVEQVSITAEIRERKHGKAHYWTPKRSDRHKQDPSEQGEEKSTAQRYRERYGQHWSDEMKKEGRKFYKERNNE